MSLQEKGVLQDNGNQVPGIGSEDDESTAQDNDEPAEDVSQDNSDYDPGIGSEDDESTAQDHDEPAEDVSQDNDGDSDYDSAIASDNDALSTVSLRSSVYDYPVHHGRTYNAFRPDTYFAPNDVEERDRLDVQHKAIMKVTGDKLFYAPVHNLQNVLDLGTGTGCWAVEMGDEYPEASITGIDISPIQPTWVPLGVKFEVSDLEDHWNRCDNSYDLIRSGQMLSGSIRDIPGYFRQAFSCCKPGGYFEVQELCMKTASHRGPVPYNAGLQEWFSLVSYGIPRFPGGGRKFYHDLESVMSMMEQAGFVEIRVQGVQIPLGPWPKDPLLREAGMYQLAATLEGLKSLSPTPLIRGLGWKPEEVEILLAHARADALAENNCYYLPWFAVWGKKPS